MDISTLKIIFYACTVILSFFLAYGLTSVYIKHERKINDLFDKSSKAATVNKLKEYYKINEKKHLHLFQYINSLILRANIRISIVNSFTVVLLSLLIFIFVYITLYTKVYISITVILSLLSLTIPCLILYAISQVVGGHTDKNVIDFSALLVNFLGDRDDISYAFEEVSKFDLKPLSQYCCDYLFDINHGYTATDALKRFSDKISNAQLKVLIITLINCNENSGKYLLVVKRFTDNYIELYDKLLDRKKDATKNRKSLFAMIIIIIGAFLLLTITNSNFINLMLTTAIGHILSTFLLCSCIVTFFIALNVGNFNFD